MQKYKTVVTDYEGMQGILDTHAAQGWRLFSLTPDTWRQSMAPEHAMDHSPFDELNAHGQTGTKEYSASYYLLIFVQDETAADTVRRAAVAEEALPQDQLSAYDEP